MKTPYLSPKIFTYGSMTDVVQAKGIWGVRDFWLLRRRIIIVWPF